jgi:proliferating cell nuclear antigen
MKIQINDKKKKETFVSLFQVLKSCTSLVNITFEIEFAHIQGMDKSHVCLFDVKLTKKWFSNYDINNVTKICFDSNIFHSIISSKSDNQDLIIHIDDNNQDILYIYFDTSCLSKKIDFKKTFKIPLAEYEYEELNIPITDYDAEFSLSSKHLSDMFSQLSNFGNDIIIKCFENNVRLITNDITGEMQVDIPIDDLNSYSIIEGEDIILTYSLTYINKMCITNKLSSDIELSLSNDCPMQISYNLGDDSLLLFFIAPKMNNE